MTACPPAASRASLIFPIGSALVLLTVLLVVPSAALGQFQPGSIVVVDYDAEGGAGALFLVGLQDDEWTVLSSGQYFNDPFDVVVDEAGRIFVADGTSAAIIEVNPDNGVQRLVSQGGQFLHPVSLVTGTGNDLLVCDTGTKSIVRVDKDSGFQELVFSGAPLISPFALARDRSRRLFVLDRVANDGGSIFRIDAQGATLISTGQYFEQISDLAIGSRDPARIYVVGLGHRQYLIAIDQSLPIDANQSIVASFGYNSSVAAGHSGESDKLFVLSSYRYTSIIEVDPETGASESISENRGISTPAGIAVYPEYPSIQATESTWGQIKDLYR